MKGKRLLIVGAGGFIGGFIARKALELGYDTTVAVRESTSRRYLDDPSLKFLVLDYDSQESMLRAIGQEQQGWDYVIYNLGATKCANFLDFNRINFEYLRRFCTVLTECGKVPEKFLYMSSLSAVGAGDERARMPRFRRMCVRIRTRATVCRRSRPSSGSRYRRDCRGSYSDPRGLWTSREGLPDDDQVDRPSF